MYERWLSDVPRTAQRIAVRSFSRLLAIASQVPSARRPWSALRLAACGRTELLPAVLLLLIAGHTTCVEARAEGF